MRSGKCNGLVVLELGNKAEHVLRAIEPDNRQAPPHVSVRCNVEGITLKCHVEVDGCENPKRILTFKNTIDDLILAVRTAVSVLEATDK